MNTARLWQRSWPWALTATLLSSGGFAQSSGEAEAVLTVGKQSVTVSELQHALAHSAPGAAPGRDTSERVRAFVDSELLPTLLLTQEARKQGLSEQPAVRARLDQILAAALQAQLERQLAPAVDSTAIETYFDQHRAEFQEPRALLLWRIVVDDPEQAQAIVAECQGTGGVARWRDRAQRDSLDEATQLTSGSLGFVRADGSRDAPQEPVSADLYRAANTIADGAIVTVPLEGGSRVAVIWRRGSRPARNPQLADVKASIVAALLHEKVQRELQALIRRLTSQYVKGLHPELLPAEVTAGTDFTPHDAFPPAVGSRKPR